MASHTAGTSTLRPWSYTEPLFKNVCGEALRMPNTVATVLTGG